jgi:ubiquitin-conjugating enzyme E2 Z
MSLPKAIRRIMADIKEYKTGPIDGTAIYQCEDPLTRIYVAVAGPKDSAYEDGVYFFEFDFPDTYPNEPPKGKFLNWQNSITRMHPNMYASGKLCLSILGTWSGPSWTSAMSLTTIILALQSIMDDNPLKNEPGYGIGVTQKHQDYHRIIEYYNLRDFVIKTLKFTTSSEKTTNNDYLVYFKDFLVSYYLNHHLSISQRINLVLV